MHSGIIIEETRDYAALIPFFIANGLEFGEDDGYDEDELVRCWRAVRPGGMELVGGCVLARREDECGMPGGEDPGIGLRGGAASDGMELVGGCVLARREGRLICDGIATDPSVRGMRIGERLLMLLLGAASEEGAEEVFLVARAPAFFAKYGFAPVPASSAPTFFECFSCPRYAVSCHPEIMRVGLRANPRPRSVAAPPPAVLY